MKQNNSRHSSRLRNYDYARAGCYFVTICVRGRDCLLGDIADGIMLPNAAGQAVSDTWHGLVDRFDDIALDEFVVMPNHVHGIIVLRAGDSATGGSQVTGTSFISRAPVGAGLALPENVNDPPALPTTAAMGGASPAPTGGSQATGTSFISRAPVGAGLALPENGNDPPTLPTTVAMGGASPAPTALSKCGMSQVVARTCKLSHLGL